MFFRRPSRSVKRPAHVSRKHRGLSQRGSFPIEALESRTLLTTLVGAGEGIGTAFEFMDVDNNPFRIVLYGNITVEALGLRVPDPADDAIDPDAVPKVVNLSPAILEPDAGYGVNLYSLYVSKADMDASISIARVPDLDADDRPMQPFGGTAGSFNILRADNGERDAVTPAANTGSLLLGARTGNSEPDFTAEEDIAILSVPFTRAWNTRPKNPKNILEAGLQVAPGVNLGQFLFGGTVIGAVNIGGSMNLFYAGELWTGDATGLTSPTATASRRNNFYVDGDLRNLMVFGDIGTSGLARGQDEPVFKTGVEIKVRGRLGQVNTRSSLLGDAYVVHDSRVRGPGVAQQEVEVRDVVPTGSNSFFEGNPFSPDPRRAAPSLGDNGAFNNDTPETAQFLGSAFSSDVGKGTDDIIHLEGSLNFPVTGVEDRIDHYAVALLAGQNVEVKTSTAFAPGFLVTGVFDPDGRLIATDNSNHATPGGTFQTEQTLQHAFRFTTSKPGIYRIAIATISDYDLSGTTNNTENTVFVGFRAYSLDISRMGDIALGGVVAAENIASLDTDLAFDPFVVNPPLVSFRVDNGDLGAITSTGAGNSIIATAGAAPYTVLHGNLRAIVGDTIGTFNTGGPGLGPNLSVPKGSVGLVRGVGTGADDAVAINVGLSTLPGTLSRNSIGVDYQLIDAGSNFVSNVLAKRGIGVIRAANIGSINFAPRLAVNADAVGNDGFIDLIDSAGAFGTLQAGGPQITTGPGGNVHFIHVADPTLVFRDRFFGGGNNNQVVLPPGQSVRYADDSGAIVKISSPSVIDNAGQQIAPTTFTILSYGIRDKGGSVLIQLDVDPGAELLGGIINRGVTIDSGSNGGTGGIEIGQINLNGPGNATNFIALTRGFGLPDIGFGNDLIMKGKVPIDVFDINSTNGMRTLDNKTAGEIVNVEAPSIRTLKGYYLGVARSLSGTEIQSVEVRRDIFPFSQQRTLIDIAGDVESIEASGPLGNIFVGGTVGTLTANSDGANTKRLYEGIVAPIVTGAHMLDVNIGEGLAFSGTGAFAASGLFAGGVIVSVTNQGAGSDIRGDIVVNATTTLPVLIDENNRSKPEVNGIGAINLKNGAIIDSDIMVVTTFEDSLETPDPRELTGSFRDINNKQIPNITSINLEGTGGIIGSDILSAGVGSISVKQGFGFINSYLGVGATSEVGGIDTDGYGIRSSSFNGGQSIGYVVARGDGKKIDTRFYSSSVRISETSAFDPFSGRSVGVFNDLHTFLGTTAAKPKNSRTSLAGTIDDSLFTGASNLGKMQAFMIRGTFDEITGESTMRVSYAQNVNSLLVSNSTDGLQFTAGTVKLVSVGKDITNTTITVDSVLQNVLCGNLKASSSISVLSGEGRLDSITTKRALFGTIAVSTNIGNIKVGTNFGSPSVSSSNDIGTVSINGSMLSGSVLRARDRLSVLDIGGDIQVNATVRARSIGSQQIDGQVQGDIITG